MNQYPQWLAELAQTAIADKRTRQGGWGAIAEVLLAAYEKGRADAAPTKET